MTHVLVSAPFPTHLMDKLRGVSNKFEVEQIEIKTASWPDHLTTQAEVFYALDVVPPLDLAPNLRWIQTHYAGVNGLVKQPIWDTGTLITSASGVHAPNIAQYVMAQMLHWANRVDRWHHYQAKSKWPKDRWTKFVPRDLRGATLGILGYGSIGREIARLAKTFGMQVLATKRDGKRLEDTGFRLHGTGDPRAEMVDRIYPPEATRSMLVECDYVVLTLPLTPQTRAIVDEDMLRAMKADSYLINVGRGGLVDETALVKALRKGWIGGAGLDVFESEPLSSESPLWQLENVLLTPHISGFSPEYDDRVTDLFAENLRRYLAGEPLLNVVNRQLGY